MWRISIVCGDKCWIKILHFITIKRMHHLNETLYMQYELSPLWFLEIGFAFFAWWPPVSDCLLFPVSCLSESAYHVFEVFLGYGLNDLFLELVLYTSSLNVVLLPRFFLLPLGPLARNHYTDGCLVSCHNFAVNLLISWNNLRLLDLQ